MARVALVTGGTRGIGAAISKSLKAAGYKVAASYAGNDAAAERFKSETGIPVYKWDVSSFDDCAAGVKKVEADLGPIDVLVNNAGITKDGAFHKMTLDQWNAVINTNLGSLFNMTRQVIEGMRARNYGRIISIASTSPTREIVTPGGNAVVNRLASLGSRITKLPRSPSRRIRRPKAWRRRRRTTMSV